MDDNINNLTNTGITGGTKAQEIVFDNSRVKYPDVSIIIPVYNEEEALPCVLDGMLKTINEDYEIIVVDDGSNDNTRHLVAAYPCRLILHTENQGKGAAIKTGIRHSKGQYIIIIDGDASYPVDVIPDMYTSLKQNDIVRCVRTEGRDNIPPINRLGNIVFEKIIGYFNGIDSADFMSGLYGIRKSHLITMDLEANGFDIETEIAIKARSLDLTCEIIPINYYQRLGDKKLKPFQDGMKILGRMAKLALTYNPVLFFILPGFTLLLISVSYWLLLSLVFQSGYRPNSFIVSGMTFLAGFQLIVLGYKTILYMDRAGIGEINSNWVYLAKHFPRLPFVFLGLILMMVGGCWSMTLITGWAIEGFGYFIYTEALIIALTMTVFGIQMLSTMLFLLMLKK